MKLKFSKDIVKSPEKFLVKSNVHLADRCPRPSLVCCFSLNVSISPVWTTKTRHSSSLYQVLSFSLGVSNTQVETGKIIQLRSLFHIRCFSLCVSINQVKPNWGRFFFILPSFNSFLSRDHKEKNSFKPVHLQ